MHATLFQQPALFTNKYLFVYKQMKSTYMTPTYFIPGPGRKKSGVHVSKQLSRTQTSSTLGLNPEMKVE